MKEKFSVSVVMPCYNSEKFLKKAVNSVLNQSLKDIELIIVDDFSKDNTVSIAKKMQLKDDRIVILTNKYNKGVCGAMNTGLDAARGKYLTRVDSDDIIDKDKLKKQFNFLEKNKNFILCSTNIYFINKRDKIIGGPMKLKKGYNYKFLYLFSNPLPAAPCMFITSIIKEKKLLFGNYTTAEDHDFISRYLCYGDFALIDEPLYLYRQLKSSLSNSNLYLTLRNSIEVCNKNVENFLGIKSNQYHQYLTHYFEVKNKKNETFNCDIIKVTEWGKEVLDTFCKKYKISAKEYPKYYDYMNEQLFENFTRMKNNYALTFKIVIARAFQYLKKFGLKETVKKTIKVVKGEKDERKSK